MRTPIRRASALAAVLGLAVAACSGGASPSPSSSPSAASSPSPSVAESPSPTTDACAAENLETKTAGTLTIGTDNPAFPPYYDPPAEGETPTDPWELGDPTNGRGFESAVAYAIAGELGFDEAAVTWIAVKFDQSFAPGPKDFDIYLTQVSDLPERREGADLSDGYYFLNQSLVGIADTPIAAATTMGDLKGFTFGAQVGTTSLNTIQDVIQPTAEPLVYDTNDAAIEALKNKQIDGLVVDLPTAFFVTAVQVDDGVIVGQFAPAGEQEHFSVVLEKDSALTECVNQAIASLKDSGTLDDITQEWLADKANAPVIQP
jgi:polar amino acid transport system substrate-binding protein